MIYFDVFFVITILPPLKRGGGSGVLGKLSPPTVLLYSIGIQCTRVGLSDTIVIQIPNTIIYANTTRVHCTPRIPFFTPHFARGEKQGYVCECEDGGVRQSKDRNRMLPKKSS